jgi:uncharacterized protein YjbI with pentapeptide repeats
VDSSVVGYDGGWNGTDEERSVWQTKPEREQKEETKQSRWGFRGKTVWDWMALLIVPLALVVIGLLFTMLQDARQQEIENQRAQQAQKIEDQRAEAERELAEQRAQDEALQAYLDQMSQLMLERKLLEAEPGDPVHTLAQARTSTVILRLDAAHNESVTRFLINSGLAVDSDPSGAVHTGPALRTEASARLLSGIALSHATLSDAQLPDADLSHAVLSGAGLSNALLGYANLSSANLSGADLRSADLFKADLSGASLRSAVLSGALLTDADLTDAELLEADLSDTVLNVADLSDAVLSGADLSNAVLSGANLSDAVLGANLSNADLTEANLSGAVLSGAQGITNEELEQQTKYLEGATMPNGQKYEDWLKDKKAREEGG